MTRIRPNYLALNDAGHEYSRPARIIGELSDREDRMSALVSATSTISASLGVKAKRTIPFGMPVFAAFMSRPEAMRHAAKDLLLTKGLDVPLAYCCEYSA